MKRPSQYRNRPVRDSRHTRPIEGFGEDKGRYFRCHHCNFVINADRDAAFGDMDSKHGVTYSVTYNGSVGFSRTSKLYLEDDQSLVLAEEDAAGTVKPPYISYTRNISGCPFCGTRSNRT